MRAVRNIVCIQGKMIASIRIVSLRIYMYMYVCHVCMSCMYVCMYVTYVQYVTYVLFTLQNRITTLCNINYIIGSPYLLNYYDINVNKTVYQQSYHIIHGQHYYTHRD